MFYTVIDAAYTDWAPRYASADAKGGKHCVVLRYLNNAWYWESSACNETAYFVCEYSKNSRILFVGFLVIIDSTLDNCATASLPFVYWPTGPLFMRRQIL